MTLPQLLEPTHNLDWSPTCARYKTNELPGVAAFRAVTFILLLYVVRMEQYLMVQI